MISRLELVSMFILTCSVALSTPVFATYSRLLLIPTARVVGDGKFRLHIGSDENINGSAIKSYFVMSEFGYTDRFEAGIDFQWLKNTHDSPIFSCKYLPSVWDKGAIGVGVYTNGINTSSSPYAVVSQNFGPSYLHFGEIRSSGHTRWFTGIDWSIDDHLLFMADYTSGQENNSSLAANYKFSDKWSVCSGFIFPNDSSRTTRFAVIISYGCSYR